MLDIQTKNSQASLAHQAYVRAREKRIFYGQRYGIAHRDKNIVFCGSVTKVYIFVDLSVQLQTHRYSLYFKQITL